jgi:outer membrane usher protein FimD/PapC
MKKKLMLFVACLLIGVTFAMAQVRRVTGVVTSSEDSEPVAGATVMVKGTRVGTMTNADGQFTLTNVPRNARTIVVSFVGMKTTRG